MLFRIKTLLENDQRTLVLECSGVAKASLYWFDDRNTVYLAGLHVSSGFRHKGLGRMLQEIREEVGRSLGADNSCLWCRKESWQHRWYQKRGYIDSQAHDRKGFVWMSKTLLNNDRSLNVRNNKYK